MFWFYDSLYVFPNNTPKASYAKDNTGFNQMCIIFNNYKKQSRAYGNINPLTIVTQTGGGGWGRQFLGQI